MAPCLAAFDLEYEDADPHGLAGAAISSPFLVEPENEVQSFSGVVLRRYNAYYGLYRVWYSDGAARKDQEAARGALGLPGD